MYSYAWTEDPIVNAISPMSGNAGNTGPINNSSTEWYTVSKALGCGDESAGEKTLACMRTKDTQTILNAFKNDKGVSSVQFRPTSDERVVFSDYARRRTEGKFIKVPYLTGNTDDEGGISFAINRPAPKPSAPVQKRQFGGAAGVQGCGPHSAALARTKQGIPAWRYLSSMIFPNSDIGSYRRWNWTFASSDLSCRQQRAVPRWRYCVCLRDTSLAIAHCQCYCLWKDVVRA
jgi:cholinesterase